MPKTQSAKKALRHDRRRALVNAPIRQNLKKILSLVRKKPSVENVKKAVKILDRAAQKHIIHSRKASRLKTRLTKKQI